MIPIKQLSIAIIGDEDLVNCLRLGGVKRYCLIKDEHNAEEEVRQALTELVGEPEIGIIGIQEDYTKYVEDLIAKVQERKDLTPVITEVPSKYGTKYEDVTAYYKAFIRKFVGFDIQI